MLCEPLCSLESWLGFAVEVKPSERGLGCDAIGVGLARGEVPAFDVLANRFCPCGAPVRFSCLSSVRGGLDLRLFARCDVVCTCVVVRLVHFRRRCGHAVLDPTNWRPSGARGYQRLSA